MMRKNNNEKYQHAHLDLMPGLHLLDDLQLKHQVCIVKFYYFTTKALILPNYQS